MIFALLGLILILSIFIVRLEVRIDRLLKGKDAKTLEDTIVAVERRIENLEKFHDDSIEYLKGIEYRLKRSIQGVETVRFNPFPGTGTGGNQSSSTAFVNERGDGVIITSMHSRDRVSIFSKPIKKFSSEYELTEEERTAIAGVKNGLSVPKNPL